MSSYVHIHLTFWISPMKRKELTMLLLQGLCVKVKKEVAKTFSTFEESRIEAHTNRHTNTVEELVPLTPVGKSWPWKQRWYYVRIWGKNVYYLHCMGSTTEKLTYNQVSTIEVPRASESSKYKIAMCWDIHSPGVQVSYQNNSLGNNDLAMKHYRSLRINLRLLPP